MATIRLALIPAKVLSDGSHKICIAIHHKEETKYIVTRFKVDSLSQFKNGQVVKRPDAALINTKLRNILNEYQEKLDSIKCIQGSFGVSPKKLLFLIMTALIVVGCSKSDEEKSDIQEIWPNGYKALTPESDYENISTTFLLFKADNNEEFDVKKQTFSGNILDYQKIQDETWNLLSKSKIKKKDGSIVDATYSIFASSIKETYTSAKVKIGKYFMVAIYSDSKTGYHWLYSNKYACQYVDIPYRYNPWDYSVVFPCDLHNYGKIEWVSWNQTPYPYEFEFSK